MHTCAVILAALNLPSAAQNYRSSCWAACQRLCNRHPPSIIVWCLEYDRLGWLRELDIRRSCSHCRDTAHQQESRQHRRRHWRHFFKTGWARFRCNCHLPRQRFVTHDIRITYPFATRSSRTFCNRVSGAKARHANFNCIVELCGLIPPAGKCLMFANVSPGAEQYMETVNTLRFASKVSACAIGAAQKRVAAE